MKALVIALSLLAGQAWAVAANTVALWNLDNDLTDSSGNGHTLTNVGGVPFVTTPTAPQGSHCAGVFSGSNRFNNASAMAVLGGSTTYTIEGYLYNTQTTVQQLFLSAGASASPSIVIVVNNPGAFKVVFDDVRILQSANNVMSINTWYYFAVVVNGTSVKGYIGTVGSTPSLVIDSTDASPDFPSAGDIAVGGFTISYGFLPAAYLYLDAVRFSNVARTSLPTSDASTATQLSPYTLNSNSPWMMPTWWFK